MRYKKYHIDLVGVTESNALPDLLSVSSKSLEGNEYLKKETTSDGIVIYRASSRFSQLAVIYIPEDHPVFNFDIGTKSCASYYYSTRSAKDISKSGDVRDLIFKYIIHPFFDSIPKNKWFRK